MSTRTERPGAGWVAFAGVYMGLAGTFNLIWGIAALSKRDYFAEEGLLFSSLNTWGWIAVLIALVQIVTGGLLFARRISGVVLAIGVAMAALVVNFMSIGAYPVWSTVALVCNGLVLWAITVHSDQFTR